NEVAAREAEDVPVAGVAGRDPGSRLRRYPADERESVPRLPPDARPAVRDPRDATHELADERLELPLDERRRLLDVGLLGLEARVAAPADEQPPVRELLPVVVALARVVRTREEPLGQRFGDEDLPADGPHGAGQRRR